jgi:RimJ/RimL family protein N-acetyltransferase
VSAPPITVLTASPEEEAAIVAAVRAVQGPMIAGPEHVDGLLKLLSDPRVSDPIYDLPRPFTREGVAAWVAEHAAKQAEGRSILTVGLDEAGDVSSYSHFAIWPERASGEIIGARRADLQNSGQGRSGVAHATALMFEVLGLRLIGLTAALDNVRSAKAIDGAGFKRMGERDSVRPDGTVRRSLYWELTRDEWRLRHRL